MNKCNILIIVLIIIIIILVCLYCKNKNDDFNEFNNINNKNIPNVIHKVIIQHDSKLPTFPLEPKELQEAHDSWKIKNPGYKIKYYSMNDCRNYLKKYFDSDHLQAFDCLNAYSKKCNLFRYCVLYNEGGWYSDWKQVCLVDNLLDKLKSEINENIIIGWDKGILFATYLRYIQNCFMGTNKGNLFLKEAINAVINNVKYKYKGRDTISESGPGLLGNLYKNKNLGVNNFKIHFEFKTVKDLKYIYYKNEKIILHKCKNCEQSQNWKDGNNYGILWRENKLYNNFIISNKIPKIMHRTFKVEFNDLNSDIKNSINNSLNKNPNFKFYYYKDIDCIKIITDNFNSDVIWAYNYLKPSAYKADLFRYCILYLYGGIYNDISQEILEPLDSIINFDKDTFVLGYDTSHFYKYNGIQINFIAAIPKLTIFKNCINQIVYNCKNNYIGNTQFDITGPYLFRHVLDKTSINYIIKFIYNKKYLLKYDPFTNEIKNKIIKVRVNNYHKIVYNNKLTYSMLWNNKDIYNNN